MKSHKDQIIKEQGMTMALLEGPQMFLTAHEARGSALTAACGDQAAVNNAYGLITQYATHQGETCKTCHGVGEVTLTVMRQPDYYENVPCPDCQGEDKANE